MRHINRDNLTPPARWEAKAQRALHKARAATETRSEVINGQQAVWKSFKTKLKKLSGGKCWYCEEKTALGDVDHFRPKNKVDECPEHEGYWWLAFEQDNYRYSCPFCNRVNKDTEEVDEGEEDDEEGMEEYDEDDRDENESNEELLHKSSTGGKGTHFPLWEDNIKRVFDESHQSMMIYEEPLLLDPVVKADTLLLTFDENGIARPARNAIKCPKEYKRAKTSIDIYHLNRPSLKRRRRTVACNKAKRLIAQADVYLFLERQAQEECRSTFEAHKGYEDTLEELSRLIADDAEFSAAAKAVLKMYRDLEHEWVIEFLNS